MRVGGQFSHAFQQVRHKSQCFEAQQFFVTAIENAHHHAFPVHGGKSRNAKINISCKHFEANSSVLRQPAFGDIELGHQFDAADHGSGHLPRGSLDRVENPVDAEPHTEFPFHGL